MNLLLALALLSNFALAKEPIRVAIVDTGISITDRRFAKVLCKEGHTDFTNTSIDDTDGHGTHIAGIIKQNAGNANYCILVYKYYDAKVNGQTTIDRAVRAFNKAALDGANIINFSAGGSDRDREEYETVKYHPEITFVVAAGNDGMDLDRTTNKYFPASYRLPNIIAVGNLDVDGTRYHNSNYAPWLAWEVGTNVMSTVPCKIKSRRQDCIGYMTGTSMAAAVRTGKLIKEMLAKP